MHWLWFAGLNIFTYSTASLFQRIAMKEKSSDPVTSAIIFQLLLSIGGALIAIPLGFHLPDLNLWPYFISSGILYATGSIFFFRAIKTIEASEMAIIGGAGTIVTLIVSFFFLSERLTLHQWIGAFLILFAVVLVKLERQNFKYNTGIWQALAGSSCYSLAVVFDGYILKTVDAISYLPLASFIPGILLLLAFPRNIPTLFSNIRQVNRNLVIYCILYVISAEAFYIPLHNGTLVSQMSAVGRASIIITVIFGMIFLNERSHAWKKLTGALLTTIGIFLIT